MKARGAAIQGALAAAGLIAAYVTWQRPPEDKDAEVVVLDASKSDLERIRYEDERRIVEIVPSGDVTWVRQTEKPPAPKPPRAADGGVSDAGAGDAGVVPASASADGGAADARAAMSPDAADAGTADGGAAPPKTREFRANETADRVVERFAPLRAVRGLGPLPEEKLKELGLEETSRSLEVVTDSGATRFRLSDESSGAASAYAMSEVDGRVYVLRSTLVSDLQFAGTRLVDRRLHQFRDDEFDAIAIRAGDQERRLVKSGDRLGDSSQGAPDELASNWHDRIWRAMAVEVLGRDETPAAGEPRVEIRVDYLRDDRTVGFIELGLAGNDVFARTEHTAGWVRLAAGTASVLDESKKVLQPSG